MLPHCQQAFESSPQEYLGTYSKNIAHELKHVFKYAFVDMVKEIGPELLLGLVLAALVAAIAPVGKFVGDYFSGGLGYLFSLVFGLMMYICSTASVPLVHAFISQGMNIGAGMVLLIAGPVTSWGTMLVLRKDFGGSGLGFDFLDNVFGDFLKGRGFSFKTFGTQAYVTPTLSLCDYLIINIVFSY